MFSYYLSAKLSINILRSNTTLNFKIYKYLKYIYKQNFQLEYVITIPKNNIFLKFFNYSYKNPSYFLLYNLLFSLLLHLH